MVFEDRVSKYPGRWTLIKADGTSEIVTLVRNDEPVTEGTPINASTLNELSTVAGALNAAEEAKESASQSVASATSAATSQTAAASSASAAKASEEAAAKSASDAKAIVSTDTTLSVSGAPADAKTTGDRLANVYSKTEADQKFGTPYSLPPATTTTLGGVKVGSGLSVYSDGTLRVSGVGLSAYPVGSIYQTTSSTSPAALFGGTWEEIASERVLMGASSVHTAGSTASAGLPDITGVVGGCYSGDWSGQNCNSGAFERGSQITYMDNGDGSIYRFYGVNFAASKSSSVYGGSSTVQPAAYYVHIWRRTA